MDLTIRQENPNDYKRVYALIAEAFATAEHRDGNEQALAVKLRAGKNFIPQLSLVAEEGGALLGHLLLTKLPQEGLLILAPLSVLPAHQNRGIGGRMLQEGHRIAREMGFKALHLVGHASYYPRFGYRPAAEFGIEPVQGIPAEAFMFLELEAGFLATLQGGITYPEEFGVF